MEITDLSFIIKIAFFLALLSFPLLGYAEIHYRFPFLPSRLRMREPEIIFDLPLRAQRGCEVPLFLFIKDAHQFPVHLKEARVTIRHSISDVTSHHKEHLDLKISKYFFSKTISLAPGLFLAPGNYEITAELSYQTSGRQNKTTRQDNYKGIPHPPFQIYLAEDPLPRLPGWFWGDLHVHSIFTDDQVEFGAPIAETTAAAQSLGLDFMAVTDHSYDLDDQTGDFLRNDSSLKKWNSFREEIAAVQQQMNGFTLIPGEEVSVGNHRGKNVHCLILNDTAFHPGSGDSAEILLNNKPDLTLSQLLQRKSSRALAIAAHPLETPPLSQKLILNRGDWDQKDCSQTQINALQILNGSDSEIFRRGLELWKKLLLQGHKTGIAAGNDAHGNFNSYRQISIPFIKMDFRTDHLLGQNRTAVLSGENKLPQILEGIRNHHTVISNGPFANFYLNGSKDIQVGSQAVMPDSKSLTIQLKSNSEYGRWNKLLLYAGFGSQNLEKGETISLPQNLYEWKKEISVNHLKDADYIRMEAFTEKQERSFFCYTNPIWLLRE